MTEDPREISHGPCPEALTIQRCLHIGSVTKHILPTTHAPHLVSEQHTMVGERKNRQRPIDERHGFIITVDSHDFIVGLLYVRHCARH